MNGRSLRAADCAGQLESLAQNCDNRLAAWDQLKSFSPLEEGAFNDNRRGGIGHPDSAALESSSGKTPKAVRSPASRPAGGHGSPCRYTHVASGRHNYRNFSEPLHPVPYGEPLGEAARPITIHHDRHLEALRLGRRA